MNPVDEQEEKQTQNAQQAPTAPVLPILLELDEETIQILLDDQIATGG
ncbi:MAG: hypothetical protein N2646_01310 [Bellilinea sp.]|nr:hypothetical protein [Bellilinea sp.]